MKLPREQEELKAPDSRGCAFEGFKDCKRGFVKSTHLKGHLEEQCPTFGHFSLTSTRIADVHHFPRTDFKILAPCSSGSARNNS